MPKTNVTLEIWNTDHHFTYKTYHTSVLMTFTPNCWVSTWKPMNSLTQSKLCSTNKTWWYFFMTAPAIRRQILSRPSQPGTFTSSMMHYKHYAWRALCMTIKTTQHQTFSVVACNCQWPTMTQHTRSTVSDANSTAVFNRSILSQTKWSLELLFTVIEILQSQLDDKQTDLQW